MIIYVWFFFNLLMWIVTATGLVMLFVAGKKRDSSWSGKAFFGALFIGWGLFNFLEGIIDHQIWVFTMYYQVVHRSS